jgi:predicted dinucleotide-binding enzyme
MKTIGILGTGSVGRTYASKFITLGYDVMIGTRDVSEKLASKEKDIYGSPPFSEWYAMNKSVRLGTFKEAAHFGEIILVATLGGYTLNALKLAEAQILNGKILIDVTNPLDFSHGMPPVLMPALSNTNSVGEEIQKTFPGLKVVKTLNTMWSGLMVNPGMLNGGDHNAFICGNDSDSKSKVKEIMISFGWTDKNIIDLGDITASRGTEMYLPLWLRIFGAKQMGAFNIKVVS